MKKNKFNPDLRTLKKDVGKAPKCNTKVKVIKQAENVVKKKK